MANIKETLSKEYINHKSVMNAEAFSFDGGQGVLVYNLDHIPPKGFVLAKNSDNEKFSSFVVECVDATKTNLINLAIGYLNKSLPDETHKAVIKEFEAQDAVSGFGLSKRGIWFADLSVDDFLNKLKRKYAGLDFGEVIDRDALVQQESNRLNKVLDLFRNSPFSEDALKSLQACDKFTWGSYYFYAEEGENGKLRRQAAEIYPMFAEFISRNSVFVRRTIQRKQPLNEGLAKLLSISEKTLRKFQGKNWSNNGVDIKALAFAANEIPVDWFPKDEQEWKSFCILTNTIRNYIGDEYKPLLDNSSEVLYKGSKGQWQELHKRCALAYVDTRPPEGTPKEFGDQYKKIDSGKIEQLAISSENDAKEFISGQVETIGIPEGVNKEDIIDWVYSLHVPNLSEDYLRNACIDTQDMIQFINEHVILPASGQAVLDSGSLSEVFLGYEQRAEGRKAATRILFAPNKEAGKSAPSVLEDVRRFHSQLPEILEKILPDTEKLKKDVLQEVADDGWPPMTDEIIAPNGLLLKPLTDPRELKAEGTALNHCVGGYSNTCRDRGHHIVSIRRLHGTDYERLSTFEVLPFERGQRDLNIRQHRGRRNGNPPNEAQEAYDWYLNEINAGRIALNYDRITSFRSVSGMEVKDDIERLCHFDWREKDQVTNAMMAVGMYVHKNITKKVRNIDDFIKHEALLDVSQSMDPTVKFAS